MSLELFIHILSVCTVVSSVSLFLTGIPICLKIRKQGKIGDISGIPFLMGFILGASWCRYGILKGDYIITGVNGLATVIFSVFIVFYLIYSWPEKSYIVKLALILSTLAVIMIWVQIAPNLAYLGIVCIILNVFNFASPLAGLGAVFRNREVSTLPLPMCVGNLLVSTQWTLYSFLTDEINIMIPNGLGMILAIIQLSLFVVFPINQKDKSPLEKLSELICGGHREPNNRDLEEGEKSTTYLTNLPEKV